MKAKALAFSLALSLTAAAGAHAAQPASSLTNLLQRFPDLPKTAQEAAGWVDRNGTLVAPSLLQLKTDIDAHQHVVETIAHSHDNAQRAQAMAQVEDISQGLSNAGIDVQRMQSDPAYAQQMQERMRRMSPQEIMAMSQQIAHPMNRDKRITNQAKAMVEDPASVRSAAEAGFAFSSGQTQRTLAHEAIWREAEAQVARINARPLKVKAPKPVMEWQSPGCEKACVAQWDTYAKQMLPLLLARADEILQVRRNALKRNRALVTADVQKAQAHLSATRYGAAANSDVNLSRITAYDVAVVGELNQMLDHFNASVKDAALVKHCGRQMILVPGTLCQ